MAGKLTEAAGGIVLRKGARGLIAVVQRSKDDAWVLPRGKLKRGENPVAGARREVIEETGHHVEVHEYLGAITYRAGGRPKVVQFWRMEADAEPRYQLMSDIVAVEWLPLKAAVRRLSYPLEKLFLRYAAARLVKRRKAKGKVTGKVTGKAAGQAASAKHGTGKRATKKTAKKKARPNSVSAPKTLKPKLALPKALKNKAAKAAQRQNKKKNKKRDKAERKSGKKPDKKSGKKSGKPSGKKDRHKAERKALKRDRRESKSFVAPEARQAASPAQSVVTAHTEHAAAPAHRLRRTILQRVFGRIAG